MMQRKLDLERPLVAFDLETTGLDVQADRIVEISCVKMFPDGQRVTRTARINPQMPISAGATRVHGISDADVAHAPCFEQLALELASFMSGCDLTGFNIEQFDLPLLTREFARVGIQFPEPGVHTLDSWRIFLKKEPRDLSAAFRTYCGQELEGAHGAEADATAAAQILMAQVTRYDDLPMTVTELDDFCHPPNPEWVDRSGKIIWVGDEAALSFGKYRHCKLSTLVERDPHYLHWMATKANFPPDVARIIQEALEGRFPTRLAAVLTGAAATTMPNAAAAATTAPAAAKSEAAVALAAAVVARRRS